MVTPLGVPKFWVIYIVSQINMYMEFGDSVLNTHWTWSRNIRIYVSGTRLNGDVCSHVSIMRLERHTGYPKKYAHGFCFAVLCCGYTLADIPISIRLTSLALWQSNDCHSASKATLMNMDKYFMRIHYERLHNHNKAKHNKTVCIFLGIYCTMGLFFYTYYV